MSICTILVMCLFVAAATSLSAAQDESASTLGEALRRGKASMNFRYRFEAVSDEAAAVKDKNAYASTLRTTLSYRSLPFHGVSGFLEAENVVVVGDDEAFNNKGGGALSNGVTDRPVVADPELTAVNQAFLGIDSLPDTTIRLGRQEILLGNVRFVGNVGWRQHHQSFDAVKIDNRSLANTTLSYIYIDQANRIFGDHKSMMSHLANGSYRISEIGTLTGYVYLLDYDEAVDAPLSTSTLGVNFTGNRQIQSDRRILFEVELAQQSDYGDNPGRVDARYYKVEGGVGLSGINAKAGLEILEGSPEDGKFTTPLATLHAYNGWADKFLVTPVNGLQDLYVSIGGSYGRFAAVGIYHDFKASTGNADYGTEIDIQATYRSPWNQVFGLKAALYNADTHSSDTNKLMLWSSYGF